MSDMKFTDVVKKLSITDFKFDFIEQEERMIDEQLTNAYILEHLERALDLINKDTSDFFHKRRLIEMDEWDDEDQEYYIRHFRIDDLLQRIIKHYEYLRDKKHYAWIKNEK